MVGKQWDTGNRPDSGRHGIHLLASGVKGLFGSLSCPGKGELQIQNINNSPLMHFCVTSMSLTGLRHVFSVFGGTVQLITCKIHANRAGLSSI